jgi:hypothetical protein
VSEPPESEEMREARIRMEIARREMEMRARRPMPADDRREGGGGHAAKAGFRGTTLLLVIVAVLGSLWLLKLASKQLELREPAKRPGAGRTW